VDVRGTPFLEIPEDPPRLGSGYQRRLSVLLAPEVLCLRDPRGYELDLISTREVDAMIERGFLRVMDASEVESAAVAAGGFQADPGERVRREFRQLVIEEGETQVGHSPATEGQPEQSFIFQPRHEHISDSTWFPSEHFSFSAPATPQSLQAAAARGTGAVLSAMADAMYERTAAQLATLEVLGDRFDADIVSSSLVAPMFRAVEKSNRRGLGVSQYVSDASELLASTVLRHVDAVENLENLSMEEVMDLAEESKTARRLFQTKLAEFVDQVLESSDAQATARRLYAKVLKPEVEAFDERFGTLLKTATTYVNAAVVNRAALVSIPLAAYGAHAGLNTAWSLVAGAAGTAVDGVAAVRDVHTARRAWPSLLLSLKASGRK